jgi:hypothetical protein
MNSIGFNFYLRSSLNLSFDAAASLIYLGISFILARSTRTYSSYTDGGSVYFVA